MVIRKITYFKKYLIRTIRLLKRVLVAWISSINNSQSDYNKHLSAFIGLIAGWKWIFNKKNDDGYNPFLKESI